MKRTRQFSLYENNGREDAVDLWEIIDKLPGKIPNLNRHEENTND